MQWKGAIAVVAATNTTTGESPCPEDPYIGQSAWYQRRFLELLAEGHTFGWAFIEGKQYIQGCYSSGYSGVLRDWLRINMLGDPAQELFQSTSVFPDDAADCGGGNDTQATAYTLSGSGRGSRLTVNVTGCVARDTDWYVLDLGSRRSVTISITRKLSMGSVKMKVFDSSGAVIGHSSTTSNDDQWTWTNTSVRTGVIYIRVKPDRFITDYALKIVAS